MWISSPVEVTWGFPLSLLILLVIGWGPVAPSMLTAAIFHELGHILALKFFGAELLSVRLSALGAEIRANTDCLSYGEDILCSAAGPAVNLALAVLFGRGLRFMLPAGANLLLALFNLLPVPALDGGRILYLIVSFMRDPFFAYRVCRWVGAVTGVVLTVAAVLMAMRYGGGFFMIPAALGVLLPQIASCQTEKNQIE